MILLLLTVVALAGLPKPALLEGVGVEEHLGRSVPRELVFRDEDGATTRLGDHLDGQRPVVLALAYLDCPMLCGLVLDGLAKSARDVGPDHRLLTVSFDPDDAPADARAARRTALDTLGREARWPFLVGEPESIGPLVEALGVTLRRDPDSGQYAHPAVVFVLTPDGAISRYVYGTRPDPEALSEAIEAAGAGRTGQSLGSWVLSCFRFDPASRRHRGTVSTFLRVGGAGIAGALGLLVAGLWLRERRRT